MTEHTHCTFCDLIHGAAEVSICHEDADSIAFMDIQPVNNGHVLVVPREHYESLLDVPPEIGLHLFRVTMQLANAVRRVTGSDDMNIVVNNGSAAGQDEPHYHVHIIPRQASDGFDIPLPFNGSTMPDRTVLDAFAARIIAALRDPMRIEHHPAPAETPADRAAARSERAVTVPTFNESNDQRRAPQASSSADSRQRWSNRKPKTDRWPAQEGAHGELLYDRPSDSGDAV
jgi:histidine triad (HIT) family protein